MLGRWNWPSEVKRNLNFESCSVTSNDLKPRIIDSWWTQCLSEPHQNEEWKRLKILITFYDTLTQTYPFYPIVLYLDMEGNSFMAFAHSLPLSAATEQPIGLVQTTVLVINTKIRRVEGHLLDPIYGFLYQWQNVWQQNFKGEEFILGPGFRVHNLAPSILSLWWGKESWKAGKERGEGLTSSLTGSRESEKH